MQIIYATDLYGEKFPNDGNRKKKKKKILSFSSHFILFLFSFILGFFPVTYITIALHQRALYDLIKKTLDYFVKRKNKYRGLLRANQG